MHLFGDTAADYLAFAEEAQESPTYTAWARGVAEDPEVLAWVEELPPVKRQPNLVFAAARWCGVPAPGPYAGLRAALLADAGPLRATVLARRTQTNEAARTATLAPVLSLVQAADPRPVALVEVGASAGLCLYPDRWDYRWPPRGELVRGDRPLLTTRAAGPLPVPVEPLRIASRTGIDLHPLDVTDRDAVAWLLTLVWPEQEHRRRRLHTAIEVALADPPDLVAGDLLTELPRVLDRLVGDDVSVVVQHSAVVAYLEPEDRRRFAAMMRAEVDAGRCRWVSNEAPQVVPGLTLPDDLDPHRFVLCLDGEPLASTHGHGHEMTWLG